MKKIILLVMIFPAFILAQIHNKIEGLELNTPCELEYMRNLGNQKNYSCVIQNDKEKIFQYSVTVQNLFNEMNNLSEHKLMSYKDSFLKAAEINAKSNNEKTEYLYLLNGQKALKITSYLTYSGNKFLNISIVLIYKQKSFIVNLTTNDLDNLISTKLVNRIKIK